MPENTERLHPLFRLVAVSAAVFILTILAMVATAFGDQKAPPARFLNAHAGKLIAAEVVVTLALGVMALVADRRRTLQNQAEQNDAVDTAEHQ